MVIDATKRGLSAARANWKLVATLWLVNAAVAMTALIPAWVALANAMGNLPLADSLARTISFGVLYDLVELHPGLLRGLGSAAVASFVLGVLAGLGYAGGALDVLSNGIAGEYAGRFGRGAFRFYGRFFRLGIATAVLAAVTAGVVAGPLFALRRWVRREYASEWLSLGVLAAALAAGALMVLLALLAQDAARVMIVRDEVRGVVRALRRGAALVWRHPVAWLGAWSVNAILLLVAFALYLALAGALAGLALLALTVLLQQLFVAVRCALRVALLGAELALVPVVPVPAPAAQEEIAALWAEAESCSESLVEHEPAPTATESDVRPEEPSALSPEPDREPADAPK